MSDKHEYIFKVIILGPPSVGKTSCVLQYTEHKFSENYIMSLGANFAIKMFEYDDEPDKIFRLQLWDLAGQDHFRFVRPSFYRGAFAVIYVFDLTRRDTFEELEGWVKESEEYTGEVLRMLVGNKADLVDERVVSKTQGKELAKKIEALNYFETSAKLNTQLEEMFEEVVRAIIKKKNY